MKKIKKDKCGYYYADVEMQEIYNWGGLGICDSCGEPIFMNGRIGKLVWVLGGCICEKCFNDWQSRNKRYEEDLALQEECAERYYKSYLGKEIEFDET